jgi:hypothetical protein
MRFGPRGESFGCSRHCSLHHCYRLFLVKVNTSVTARAKTSYAKAGSIVSISDRPFALFSR